MFIIFADTEYMCFNEMIHYIFKFSLVQYKSCSFKRKHFIYLYAPHKAYQRYYHSYYDNIYEYLIMQCKIHAFPFLLDITSNLV